MIGNFIIEVKKKNRKPNIFSPKTKRIQPYNSSKKKQPVKLTKPQNLDKKPNFKNQIDTAIS